MPSAHSTARIRSSDVNFIAMRTRNQCILLRGSGPTIAHGMVYFMSDFNGASSTDSNGNNVMLAFAVEGK